MFPAGVYLQNGPLCTNYDIYLMSFLFTKDLKDRDFLQWKTSSAGQVPLCTSVSFHSTILTSSGCSWRRDGFLFRCWNLAESISWHGNNSISSVGPSVTQHLTGIPDPGNAHLKGRPSRIFRNSHHFRTFSIATDIIRLSRLLQYIY